MSLLMMLPKTSKNRNYSAKAPKATKIEANSAKATQIVNQAVNRNCASLREPLTSYQKSKKLKQHAQSRYNSSTIPQLL